MSGPSGSRDGINEAAWERAWSARYEQATPAGAKRRRPRSRPPLTHLLIATAVLGTFLSSIAIAESGGGATDVRQAGGAARVGDAITLGERNPRSGGAGTETSLVADAGNGGLVLRPSNTAKGGRAVSATCDNDGTTEEDGCAVYVNKGQGAAATFRTQGSVPFAIRSTNNGRVQHLNADMVDGQHASNFLTRGDAGSFLGANAKAADSEALDGEDSSAFLRANGKAADSDTLDGQDSSAFLGSTAKAADADKLDGIDSLNVARLAGGVFSDGDPTNIGYTSSRSALGVYRVDFPAGTFKTSTSCKPPIPMVIPRSNTAQIATVEDGSATCNAGDGSGGFGIRTFTHAGAAADAHFWFIVV